MNPIEQIADLLRQLKERQLLAPICLSTVRVDGFPNCRFVDLKLLDGDALIFASDVRSVKARDFGVKSMVAAAAWWEVLQVQVRVIGRIESASDAVSDRLFSGRSTTAQAIATFSVQSQPLDSLDGLRAQVADLVAVSGSEIPRPATWRAYAIIPDEIEILRFAPDRIHFRTQYRRVSGVWVSRLLSP